MKVSKVFFQTFVFINVKNIYCVFRKAQSKNEKLKLLQIYICSMEFIYFKIVRSKKKILFSTYIPNLNQYSLPVYI